MSILELLKKLSKKELKELKEKFNVEKLEELYDKLTKRIVIIANYGTDNALETINNLLENKSVQSVSDTLVESFIVYKEKNNYYLTEEALEAFGGFELEEGKFSTHLNAVEYYLLSNGALKKNEVIKLCQKSGYNITEEELEMIIDGNLYVEKNDIIYYDDELDITYNEVKERKVANCYVMDMTICLAVYLFPLMVREALWKQFHDDEGLNEMIPQRIVLTFMSAEKSEKITKKYLKDINFKVSKEEKSLLEIMEGIVKSSMPIWTCGGFSIVEANKIVTEEEYQNCLHTICEINLAEYAGMFESELTESNFWDADLLEDNDALYILAYVTLNGVMGIGELEDILKNKHNLKISKKKIISYADSFNIIHDDKYLYIIQEEEIVSMVKFAHNMIKDYKVIENPSETLEHYNTMLEKFSKLLGEYVIGQEKILDITLLLAISPNDVNGIKQFIKEEKIKIKKGKDVNELARKLEKLSKDMPVWMLSGHTANEYKESKMIR